MRTLHIAETIHQEPVKGGDVYGQIGGKSVKIDINTLRAQIPAHCFQPNFFTSLGWVFHDLAILAAIFSSTVWVEKRVSVHWVWPIRLIVYPYLASLPLTGLWVLAHECGHGAFSTNKTVANIVGFFIHSALLTPYFSWRSSHARHHQFANNLSTDLNYVPPKRDEYQELFRGKIKVDMEHAVEDAPIIVILRIILQQIIGWPWYLLTHITAGLDSSPKKSRGWWDNSHFLPNSSLFRNNEFWNIVLTDFGLAGMIYVLYTAGQSFGSVTIMWAYVLPWMWVNHWIVMITYLHHTSPSLPKFTAKSWTYMRGALATVDRDPGFVLKYLFHHIIDLHVIHHLFPRIPHYHAAEATTAIITVLGQHYHSDSGSYWGALWTAFTQCQWVQADSIKTQNAGIHATNDKTNVKANAMVEADDDGILWYRPGPMPAPTIFMRAGSVAGER